MIPIGQMVRVTQGLFMKIQNHKSGTTIYMIRKIIQGSEGLFRLETLENILYSNLLVLTPRQ